MYAEKFDAGRCPVHLLSEMYSRGTVKA